MSEIKEKLDRELRHVNSDKAQFEEIVKKAEQEEKVIRINKHKKTTSIMKVAGIAAVVTMLSVGSVFGYEYIAKKYQVPVRFDDHLGQAQPDAPIYEVQPDKTLNEQESAKGDRVTLEWGKYTLTNHKLIMNVTLRYKDGSMIFDEDENKAVILSTVFFDNVEITLDGNTSDYGINSKQELFFDDNGGNGSGVHVFPLGYEDDGSAVSFEIQYLNFDTDLSGRSLTIKLENVGGEYFCFEGIGSDKTVGELLSGGIEADASDFVSDDSVADDSGYLWDGKKYSLLPGDNKIYFSSEYPECYIDNYGFANGQDFDSARAFFMTIVCDEASREDMKKVCFQNTISGWQTGHGVVKELEDGRLQLYYTVNSDIAYTNGGRSDIDTNMSHLDTLVLKKNVTRQKETIVTGCWETSLTLEKARDTVKAEINLVIPNYNNQGDGLMAESFSMDNLKMTIKGTAIGSFDLKYFGVNGENTPVIVMKDGTRMQADSKSTDNVISQNFNTGEVTMDFSFPSVVNLENVAGVEFHGVTVWSAE